MGGSSSCSHGWVRAVACAARLLSLSLSLSLHHADAGGAMLAARHLLEPPCMPPDDHAASSIISDNTLRTSTIYTRSQH